MKTLITSFLLFFISAIYSQKSGKIGYKMYLNFTDNIQYESSLIFDNKNSLFIFKTKNEGYHEIKESSLKSISIDTTTNILLLDKNKNILLESHPKKNFFTYENTPKIKWELLQKSKDIENITCLLAKTSFRGRVFYAWYAPNIPVSYGPWKLNGLPGLIIEAYDEKKEVIFQFSKIQIPYKYDFNRMINKANESSNISLLEYISKQKKINIDDLESTIKTRFPRGGSVKNVKIIRTGIELNYNDVFNNEN